MQILIHPTAVIHSEAVLDPTVQVGPYSVIGAGVKVGANCQIGAHVVIEGPAVLGMGNKIYPGAVIGTPSQDQKYDGAESSVRIGDYNCIREYVTINRANGAGDTTIIGNHNLLLAYVHVAHDCVIEDQVVITNAASIAGHVRIESKARIGGMVGVHQFVHIGRLAMVGAMSRLDRDVPPYMLVEGHPARARSLNQVGLRRAGVGEEDMRLLKQAFRSLYRRGLPLSEAIAAVNSLPSSTMVANLQQFLAHCQDEGRRGLTPGQREVQLSKPPIASSGVDQA